MKKIIIAAAVITTALVLGIIAFMIVSQKGVSTASNMSQLSVGEKYLSDLNFEQAVATLENVIEIEPNNAEAYLSLAKAYTFMGDVDSASTVLQNGYESTKSEVIKRELDKLSDSNSQPSNEQQYNPTAPTIEIAGRYYPEDTTELILRDCGLTDADLESISKLKYLERLDISGNKITDISALANVSTLRKLYAANNSISDISSLKGLTNLEYVGLRNNNISDASPLIDNPNLKYLHLADNNITAVSGIGENLLLLYLEGNNISNTSAIKSPQLLYCDIKTL